MAIVAVVSAGGGLNLPCIGLPSLGSDSDEAPQVADTSDPVEQERPPREEKPELPASPDVIRGTDSYALTRPANLRRALRVLDARRRQVEGVFDGLRIAPGRIDTVIVRPDDRRNNLQVAADYEISFESTIDFPTQTGFRKGGIDAREVPVRAVGPVARDRPTARRQRRPRR